MDQCDDIAPLLSAYNDAELSPAQTEQLTHHLDRCEHCKDTLLDYIVLGHHLRMATQPPALEGFAEAVQARIVGTRRPLRKRLRFVLGEWRDAWLTGVAVGSAALAVAIWALVLLAPATVRSWLLHLNPSVNQSDIAHNHHPSTSPPAASVEDALSNQFASPDSEAVISRLEAKPDSVALWSEPDTKTTVIWLNDDVRR